MEGNTASDFVSSQGCDSCLGIMTVGVGRRGLLSSLCVVLDCVVSLCLCALLSRGNTASDFVSSHDWDSCVGYGRLLSSLCVCVVLVCVVSLCLCALSGGNIAADLVWSHGWDSCVGVRKVAGVEC